MSIHFCQNLEENSTETYDMIKMAFREDSIGRNKDFEWFCCFKEAQTSVESDDKFEARQKCFSQFSSVKTVLCIMRSLERVTQ
jgi:hypothetical protein